MAGRYLPTRKVTAPPPPVPAAEPAPVRSAPLQAAPAAPVHAPSASPRPQPREYVPTIPPSGELLRSEQADNPKMKDILAKFVSRLPERVTQLQKLLDEEDLDALKQAAHQLKGAAGGYGFAPLTDAAGRLEARIKTHDLFDAIAAEVRALVSLISRVEGFGAAAGGPPKRKVLLVDDDPAIHDLIRVSLGGEPIDVHGAADAAGALAAAAAIKPDIILLDLELGDGANGFDVCRQLKQDPTTAAIPLIFITSASAIADKITGLGLGAVDYVTKPFDPAEMSARISAALRSKQLQDQLARNANVDVLTGVGNRRYFDQRVATELSRSRRQGAPLACIMLDVDHFQVLNDTFGHPAGDEVLRRLGELLHHSSRAEDVVCRYGGEEFVILTPGLDRKAASAFAERLRRDIASLILGRSDAPMKITCSFGVAEVDAHTQSSADLVRRADKALYEAKRAGRNRVMSLVSKPPSTAAA
jgi:diguanylate cyclase (GGDEF)-like protein